MNNNFRYKSLGHVSNAPKANPDRFQLLLNGIERHKEEGYNSLKYNIISFRLLHLYTYALVDLENT